MQNPERRTFLIKVFSQRRFDAHKKIKEYGVSVSDAPYTACLLGGIFTNEVAKHTVATDVITVLERLEPDEDPIKAIITELQTSLQGKLAIGPESNMYAMMLRMAMIEVILETVKYLES